MSTSPKRLRRSRGKGSRLPAGAVVVTRPTKWGNPFAFESRTKAVEAFDLAMRQGLLPITIADVRRELAGRDLACWCPLDSPCHADVLLEIANNSLPGDDA